MPTKRRQLRTLDYSQEARDRLAAAVTTARLAAGHKWRTDFAKAAKVSIRSLSALEMGEPGVGQATLFAVASALPGWTEDTPRSILEGGTIPELASSRDTVPATTGLDFITEVDLVRALEVKRAVLSQLWPPEEVERRMKQELHEIDAARAARDRQRRSAG